MSFRIGQGYDVHQFCENRPLILGGVTIPFPKGLLGHSDADVLTHAIMDALLGALSLGSLGDHFPDNNPLYKDSNSMNLLDEVMRLIHNKGYDIVNTDSTVVTEEPKLKVFIDPIRRSLAERLSVDFDQVSVKATTSEKMGFVGRQEGIAVHSVVLLKRV